MAGLIDGEGCIIIEKQKGKGRGTFNPYGRFLLRLEILNTDSMLMEWLRKNYGGYVFIAKTRQKIHHKFEQHWRLHSQKAASLLESCLPFLKVKTEQAKSAISFQKTFPSKIERHSNGQVMRLDSKLFEERQSYYEKMKTLNRKGC